MNWVSAIVSGLSAATVVAVFGWYFIAKPTKADLDRLRRECEEYEDGADSLATETISPYEVKARLARQRDWLADFIAKGHERDDIEEYRLNHPFEYEQQIPIMTTRQHWLNAAEAATREDE